MKLFFRKTGEGSAIVILHGVFGSGDNLFTTAKTLAEKGYEVFLPDARNHGQSPRSEDFNYEVMAADLDELLTENEIKNPILIGHSMGGKTVMQFAANYSNFLKIIVVDIAPRYYPTHHNHILAGLNAIPIRDLKSRKEAEEIFSSYVSDLAETQFILKNLYRTDEGFDWRINIPVIAKNIYQVGSEIPFSKPVVKPALFIRGGDSSYITDEDQIQIKNNFLNAEFVTIEGANHWVHATRPVEFIDNILQFIQE